MTAAKEPTPLDLACADLEEAKAAEDEARARRLLCEEAVLALVGVKDEGTRTKKAAFYQASTAQTLTRSLVENYGEVLDALPAEVFNALVKYKPALDVRAFKALEDESPEYYRIAQAAVIAKPGKPQVKVRLLEDAA